MELRVAGFLDNSLVNGEGLRTVVFVSGCSHNCPGCHNKDMQDYNYGETIDVKTVFQRIQRNMPLVKGVTFSGGEPFQQSEALCELAAMIKAEGLSLWCYTGYTYEQLLTIKDEHMLSLLSYIDVLVDGPFLESLRDNAPRYAGSSNQRILLINA